MADSTTVTEISMTSSDFISLIINIKQSFKYPQVEVFVLGAILGILRTRSRHLGSWLSSPLSLPNDLLILVEFYFNLLIVHPESKQVLFF